MHACMHAWMLIEETECKRCKGHARRREIRVLYLFARLDSTPLEELGAGDAGRSCDYETPVPVGRDRYGHAHTAVMVPVSWLWYEAAEDEEVMGGRALGYSRQGTQSCNVMSTSLRGW